MIFKIELLIEIAKQFHLENAEIIIIPERQGCGVDVNVLFAENTPPPRTGQEDCGGWVVGSGGGNGGGGGWDKF